MSDPAKLKRYADSERAKGIYISNSEEWSKLETELEQLQMQLGDLSWQPADNTQAMNALQMKVKQIENKLAFLYKTFAETQLSIAEQQYDSAKQKQEQIAGYFEAQRREALQYNKQLADYTILKSDFEQTKKLCDILDDRIKEINITEDSGSLNISVLETARPADKPSKPPKARYMAISLLLGLVLAGGLALVRDRMDQRLRSMEEINATTGLPALGVIPSMSRRDGPAVRGKKAYLDSRSVWAETYRTMRTAVLFCTTKAKSKTILVTSPEAADGKSTVVSNLAIAMAQAGQKTLILEADFRKPMQSKIFGVNHSDKGLAGVLGGANQLDEVIKTTCVPDLDLLTCGQDVTNPSEMLYSDNFAKAMKLLTKQYDRIIVDSPPVLPVTDAQVLASICQITILVLRADKSTRKASRQACDALLRVGAQITGVVVNDVPKNGRFGYYGVDGYYNDSKKTGSGRRTNGIQQPDSASRRQELCARIGSSGSQRIVGIASPKKKTAAVHKKSTAVAAVSDKTESLNDSGSINIAEKQIITPDENEDVRRHEEPAEAFDTT